MKQQVLYIHGGESFLKHEDFIERLRTKPLWHMESASGSGVKKWTKTLAEDLGDDYEVIMPPMPNGQNAKFEEWQIWFERHFEYVTGEPILIGHSQGAMFLAKYLISHKLPFKTRALFLLAGAYDIEGFTDTDCGDFLIKPQNLSKLGNRFSNIVIMHSKDDFVVPFPHGEALAKALPEAEFMVFEDKNHFLIEEFPELIEKIKSF